MKAAVNSSIILGATLLVGVVIGLLGQGALQRARALGGAPPSRRVGFVFHMQEVLQLRAEQRATVLPVVESTADANQRVIDAAKMQLRSLLDTMSTTLAPMLDQAQRARLTRVVKELPDPFRPPPPRDGRGPPPPPPR